MGCHLALPVASPSVVESSSCSRRQSLSAPPEAADSAPHGSPLDPPFPSASIICSPRPEQPDLRTEIDVSQSEPTTQTLANAVFALDPDSITTSMSREPSILFTLESDVPPFSARSLSVRPAPQRHLALRTLPPLTGLEHVTLTDGADDVSQHPRSPGMGDARGWRGSAAMTPSGPDRLRHEHFAGSPLAEAARTARKHRHRARREGSDHFVSAPTSRPTADFLSVVANPRT